MNQFFNQERIHYLFNSVLAVVVLLAAFLGVKVIGALKEYPSIGRGVYPANVITVNGTGEATAIPDIATFSFSVSAKSKEMSAAQDAASKAVNTVIDALKNIDIAEKDIKTISYSSGPQYEWRESVCPKPMTPVYYDGSGSVSTMPAYYCPPSKQTLIGYEVVQTLSVKVRKTADAGKVLSRVGQLGAENISGISFIVDDMDKVQAEARDKAITDAKAKAEILAKSLGIKLNKIVNFYENGNPYPYGGMAYGMAEKNMAMDGSVPIIPQIPAGENTVTSNVSITYEVK